MSDALCVCNYSGQNHIDTRVILPRHVRFETFLIIYTHIISKKGDSSPTLVLTPKSRRANPIVGHSYLLT